MSMDNKVKIVDEQTEELWKEEDTLTVYIKLLKLRKMLRSKLLLKHKRL